MPVRALGTAHRLWLRLPAQARLRAFSALSAAIAPRPMIEAQSGGFPVAVAGMLRSASGLGQGARLMLESLREGGITPAPIDLSAAFGQCDLPPLQDGSEPAADAGGSLIIHINAPYLPYALLRLPRGSLNGRRIIGYWAWELPAVPRVWRFGMPFVHEIWVPSRFVRDAVTGATETPVHVVPHALPAIAGPAISRHDLGIPEDALVVLGIVNLGSNLSRKNPLAAIAAFRKAFGDACDRLLVLKLIDRGAAATERRRLEQAVQGASNIRIIDQVLSRDQISDLIAAADIVLSLHRSEGFGLVLAEAMQRGKAVVATGWSGNLDFMTEQNSALVSYSLVPTDDPQGTYALAGQCWAEPDIEHAATWLNRLAEDLNLRRHLGEVAAASVAAQLSPKQVAQIINELLCGNSHEDLLRRPK